MPTKPPLPPPSRTFVESMRWRRCLSRAATNAHTPATALEKTSLVDKASRCQDASEWSEVAASPIVCARSSCILALLPVVLLPAAWVGWHARTIHPRALGGGGYELMVQFQLCGGYCGPGWCKGEYGWEDNCNARDGEVPESSCTDRCCMAHDTCCVIDAQHPLGSEKECNQQMVDCLEACGRFDLSCVDDLGVPVPGAALLAWASYAANQCCGLPCPPENETLMHRNQTDY